MTFHVEDPGPLALIQDRGRPGMGHLGVTTSGAFDRRALRQANALLGNPPDAAAIELLGGGIVLRAGSPHVIAVTGSPGAIGLDGRVVAEGRAIPVAAGQRLRIDSPRTGLRSYLGVAGGIVIHRELGSCATDTLAGLGPAPLAAGDVLEIGPPARLPDLQDVLPLGRSGDVLLDVVLGPRDDWFTRQAVRHLLEAPWRVSPASDRIGVRLSGPTLDRRIERELPSEPCVRGSIQVSADGQPIVFGPDHPVTGGYPVIAVVTDAHTDRLAQARPGDVVRLRPR